MTTSRKRQLNIVDFGKLRCIGKPQEVKMIKEEILPSKKAVWVKLNWYRYWLILLINIAIEVGVTLDSSGSKWVGAMTGKDGSKYSEVRIRISAPNPPGQPLRYDVRCVWSRHVNDSFQFCAIAIHSPLWGWAGDRIEMVHCGTVSWGTNLPPCWKYVPQNSPTIHFDNHLDPVSRATSKWRIIYRG